MRSNVLSFFGFFTISQDETAVILTLGQFTKTQGPGLGFIIPIIQTVIKTKSSILTMDLPDQKIVLSGNIAVKISGSVNFKVANARRALLEVNDYEYSLKQLSLTTIADVLGTKTIEEIRSHKKSIADQIENIVAETASKWGLADVDIRLTDAEMDEKLLRAMMRETEAEKEANSIVIRASVDKQVAEILVQAARTLNQEPGALTLRVLQTLTDLSNDKATVVIPLPMDMLTHLNPHSKEPKTTVKTAFIQQHSDSKKANCPSCGQLYKVDNVLVDPKFDIDPNSPGIQLQCKKCHDVFTLAASLNS
jgi:regulator of protease activity HflC (stomatin/prohibitin superfamily)